MHIDRETLARAVAERVIDGESAERLGAWLDSQPASGPRFDLTHILYYLGGLIAIGAMSLFMTLGWERYGGWAVFFLALGYTGVALRLTAWFLARGLAVPAGIMTTFTVALVPLGVFGLQHALGLWEGGRAYREYHVYVDWRWVMMELATLLVAAAMFVRWRFPFMVMPVAVTLWYMSMDLAPLLFGADLEWTYRKWVSIWFGLITLVLAFLVELRTRRVEGDYAFWLYLFGLMAFWGGLSTLESGSELARLGYCAINVALVLVGAVLGRRAFPVFGGLGVAAYLGYLARRVFADSLLFPVVLAAIGIGIVFLGVWWQRRESVFTARLRAALPTELRELLARRE